jgi:type IV pilus assembly protein PilA
LVEIMIVVTIIGLLAALALPAFTRVRQAARQTAFINDLRTGRTAFETFALEQGAWPPDGIAGIPAIMNDVLLPERWSLPTPIGGFWDWDFNQFGFVAGLSVRNPTVSNSEMQQIDAKIDDGNLTTGVFQQRSNGFIYVLER